MFLPHLGRFRFRGDGIEKVALELVFLKSVAVMAEVSQRSRGGELLTFAGWWRGLHWRLQVVGVSMVSQVFLFVAVAPFALLGVHFLVAAVVMLFNVFLVFFVVLRFHVLLLVVASCGARRTALAMDGAEVAGGLHARELSNPLAAQTAYGCR